MMMAAGGKAGPAVLFCGGGTGGHVNPGLAVAAALRARGVAGLRWIGDPTRIEATLVPEAGIPLLPHGLRRPRLLSPRWWWHALATVRAVRAEFRRERPAVVVALGGYAALVPGLLARWMGIPLAVMEQNAHAGKTNRTLAAGAAAVFTQFEEAARGLPPAVVAAGRVRRLGNPVRCIAPRARGGDGGLAVLVVGGSLSARSLNDLLVAAAPHLAGVPGLRLVHLAGKEDEARVRAAYAAAGVPADVRGYERDMPALYAQVDLAVARSGATTVAELCCAGIGALYVPLPWAAEDHQTANAQAVARVGGAEVLPQAGTTGEALAARLRALAADRGQVARLGAAALTLARPKAAADVADVVLALAAGALRPVSTVDAVQAAPAGAP